MGVGIRIRRLNVVPHSEGPEGKLEMRKPRQVGGDNRTKACGLSTSPSFVSGAVHLAVSVVVSATQAGESVGTGETNVIELGRTRGQGRVR